MGRYRDRIVIEEYEIEEGGLKDTKKWKDKMMMNGRLTTLSPSSQALYDQIRNSDLTKIIEFPGEVHLSMSEHRFRHVSSGVLYDPIEPPKVIGAFSKRTRIAVQEWGQ